MDPDTWERWQQIVNDFGDVYTFNYNMRQPKPFSCSHPSGDVIAERTLAEFEAKLYAHYSKHVAKAEPRGMS